MKIVLAGEDQAKRAAREAVIIGQNQSTGSVAIRVDLGKTDPEQLLQDLGTQPMFVQPQIRIVSSWEKLRSPKMALSLAQALVESADDVLIVINKELTPGQKKLFDPSVWKIENFPLPKSVFLFCDALKLKPYEQVHL